MKHAAVLLFIMVSAVSAQAQAMRTWVSGEGDDVNPCSRTAPCKTWAGAISKTAAGGEINALDPGGYGTLTITKSITIDGGGTFASALNNGGINGFVINDSLTANPGTINVTIRNVSINGGGGTKGLNGIRFISGKKLVVDHVTITNQSNRGIDMSTNVANAELSVRNVTVDYVDGIGLGVTPVSGPVFVTVTDSNIGRSSTTSGAFFSGNVRAQVSDSSFNHNRVGGGVTVAGSAEVTLDRVQAFGNSYGVFNFSGTPITRLKDCVFVINSVMDAQNSAGTMVSYRSNIISTSEGLTSVAEQ